MDFMDIVQEVDTIEILDIWNEEFGGIEIDWKELNDSIIGKNNRGEKQKDQTENSEEVNNSRPKRGRPRLKPLKPEVLSLRRDVSIKSDYKQYY